MLRVVEVVFVGSACFYLRVSSMENGGSATENHVELGSLMVIDRFEVSILKVELYGHASVSFFVISNRVVVRLLGVPNFNGSVVVVSHDGTTVEVQGITGNFSFLAGCIEITHGVVGSILVPV